MSFKLLGFPLEEIRRLLSDPTFDVRAALELQRRLLTEKTEEVRALIGAVDAALAALDKGEGDMDDAVKFAPFGDFDPALYEEEARERWGDTAAYREAARRTAGYGPTQWAEVQAESDGIYRALAVRLAAGAAPTEAAVAELAERHRRHIDRWFYPCSMELHRALGEMYVSDERFTRNLDRYGAGLARFLRDAIAANAG
jgi:DNA-binding transcriptional MerR regulator